jgi:glycogen operon protein
MTSLPHVDQAPSVTIALAAEMPYAHVPGSPLPQGVHLAKDGVNFSLFSRYATKVWLLLFDHVDATSPMQSIELDQHYKTGDMAHPNPLEPGEA